VNQLSECEQARTRYGCTNIGVSPEVGDCVLGAGRRDGPPRGRGPARKGNHRCDNTDDGEGGKKTLRRANRRGRTAVM